MPAKDSLEFIIKINLCLKAGGWVLCFIHGTSSGNKFRLFTLAEQKSKINWALHHINLRYQLLRLRHELISSHPLHPASLSVIRRLCPSPFRIRTKKGPFPLLLSAMECPMLRLYHARHSECIMPDHPWRDYPASLSAIASHWRPQAPKATWPLWLIAL